ncbi:MAG TPA: hypothetical protein VFV70_07435 [Hyphomonadaceae bacterium]|nr:hypothetical protein [Hyphomonadaceae bacterium]
MIKATFLALAFFSLSACVSSQGLRLRHGSPLHTYSCADGKTFQVRQIISGEVEVTAGGRTRDVTNANGDLVPFGPHMTPIDEATRLTGMPGGPYEGCFMEDGEA